MKCISDQEIQQAATAKPPVDGLHDDLRDDFYLRNLIRTSLISVLQAEGDIDAAREVLATMRADFLANGVAWTDGRDAA